LGSHSAPVCTVFGALIRRSYFLANMECANLTTPYIMSTESRQTPERTSSRYPFRAAYYGDWYIFSDDSRFWLCLCQVPPFPPLFPQHTRYFFFIIYYDFATNHTILLVRKSKQNINCVESTNLSRSSVVLLLHLLNALINEHD
jgi:hypothetical protein